MKNLLKLFLLSAVFLVGSVLYTAISFYQQNADAFHIGLKLILLGIGLYLFFIPKTISILKFAIHTDDIDQIPPKDFLWLVIVGMAWLFIIEGLLA